MQQFIVVEGDATEAPRQAPQVGDVLVHCWGYERTNADFWQVTACSGRSITIHRIGADIVSSDNASFWLKPKRDDFSTYYEPMRKRLCKPRPGMSYAIKMAWNEWATLYLGGAVHHSHPDIGH